MKANMTHNESVRTFDDIQHHLELKDERLKVANPEGVANVIEFSSRKASRPKRKRNGNPFRKDANDGPTPKKAKATKRLRGKCGGKKDKTKVTCYNYEKLGHFACECTEPNKVPSNLISNFDCFVTNQNLNAYPIPIWTADSRATDHLAWTRVGFV